MTTIRVPIARCTECYKPATGTAWQSYHGYPEEVLSAKPVCEFHADYFRPRLQTVIEYGRAYGYLPEIVTNDCGRIRKIIRGKPDLYRF